jgi:hypothetical protein
MPAFFSTEHGIDDEIYWFLRRISKFFEDKTYCESIEIIGLMPVVAPEDMLDEGAWKEFYKFDRKCKLIIVSRRTDYIAYLNADMEGRKRLMIENILVSVKSIKKKEKFDYDQFEKDLIEFTCSIL